MKQVTVINEGNNFSTDNFSSFCNNVIVGAATRKIIGGEDEIPLPEEGNDFVVIEDIVDL